MNYKDTLLLINSSIGPKNNIIDNLIGYFGEAEKIIENFGYYKNDLEFISEEDKIKIEKSIKSDYLDNIKEYILKENIKITTKKDDAYPEKLNLIENSPFILYTKGIINNINKLNLNIGVVGSRKATNYGKWVCEKFCKDLSLKNVAITSGMAIGIDTISHKTSLENKGTTIAVLGCGVDVVYPKRNKKLYDRIVNNGLIISEFPLKSQARPYNFPVRNRLISGLSDGLLVVEASDKSGTLITATYAAEQGKEIFAVPGNIDNYLSKGTNQLIREGAKITVSSEDILEEFSFLDNVIDKTEENINLSDYDDEEIFIINLLKEGSKNIVEISEKASINQKKLLSKLTLLEMQGIISQEKGKNFRLKK